MKKIFKVIGFDADDTLWVNETYYRDTEAEFCRLMSDFCTDDVASELLFKTEVKNLNLYGYGSKGFILSMIEASLLLSEGKVSPEIINMILELGKEQINKPLQLLDGIEDILKSLSERDVKLIVATKGDLLDQERKLRNSGIEHYFHHIEVMSDKKSENYQKLLSHLDINPEDFLMIGNSLKSDVLPVLDLGGNAVHVPYHTTWQHEIAEKITGRSHFEEISDISELTGILDNWKKRK